MRKNNAARERILRIEPVRIIMAIVFISVMIVALAGEVSAQQLNRPRYTEEEREAIRREHTARILEKLDLTSEQKEKLRPLLEEGYGLHRTDRFARNRMSEERSGRSGRMMRRNAEMARCCRDHRCTGRPDDSYHNGRVNRYKRQPRPDCRLDLSPGTGFHGGSFPGGPFHKNDRLMGRRHEQRKEIERILTKEQIEKLHDIRVELRKEMLEKDASDKR